MRLHKNQNFTHFPIDAPPRKLEFPNLRIAANLRTLRISESPNSNLRIAAKVGPTRNSGPLSGRTRIQSLGKWVKFEFSWGRIDRKVGEIRVLIEALRVFVEALRSESGGASGGAKNFETRFSSTPLPGKGLVDLPRSQR